jgi:hypothetical protein
MVAMEVNVAIESQWLPLKSTGFYGKFSGLYGKLMVAM